MTKTSYKAACELFVHAFDCQQRKISMMKTINIINITTKWFLYFMHQFNRIENNLFFFPFDHDKNRHTQ